MDDVDAEAELGAELGRLAAADAVVMRERAARGHRGVEGGAPGGVVLGLGLGHRGRAAGEGEVDAAPVRVGVGEVRHHEDVAPERGADAVVEIAQARPGRGDLHRVAEGAGHEDRGLPVADAVAVREPVARRLLAERGGAVARGDERGAREIGVALAGGAFEDHHQARALEDARAEGVDGLVEQARGAEDAAQREGAGAGRVDVGRGRLLGLLAGAAGPAHRAHLGDERVEGIVEASDGGAEADLEHVAHRRPARLDGGEREGAVGARLGDGVEAEGGRGDHAKHALAADEEREQIRAVGAALEAHDLAAADDALERGDHVLDLAVAARALAGAARGDPAADGGAEDRRGEMPRGEALGVELFLEPDAERAGLDLERRDGGVEAAPAGEALEVEHHGARVGEDPPQTPEPAPKGTRGTPASAQKRTASATSAIV